MTTSRFTVLYIIVLFAQVVIGNYCDFTQLLFITVLPSMIMMLPPSVSTRKALTIAFFSALFIDLATESIIGINVFAAVPTALVRRPVITMLFGDDPDGRGKTISMSGTGFLQVCIMILISTAIFLALYLWADGAGLGFSVAKFFVSLVASTICSIGACDLLASGHRR